MESKLLYKFAKNFVDEYEEFEEEKLKSKELGYYKNSEPEYSYNCEKYKAGLQAVVVDDFIQQLPPELQSEIVLEFMKIKTGGNFTF